MMPVFTPSLCYIDLDAIAHNFRELGSPERLMPVIKSDAYGHGLLQTARTLAAAGARYFAVGGASEGAALREAGFSQDILLLMGCLSPEDWGFTFQHGLIPLAGSFDALEMAASRNKPLRIAIKVDTGMSRLGFDPQEAQAVCDFLLLHPWLQPVMLVSHLACADMPGECAFTAQQGAAFDNFYSLIADHFPDIRPSLDNSAAALAGAGYAISRPGLAIYGHSPLPGPLGARLRPAMSVSTPIIHIRNLQPGQSVSYGRIYTAQRPMRIGITACGYANGFARALSNKASMLVHGLRTPQIGRVCMGMTMIDLTGVPRAQVGDTAWLLGGPDGRDPAISASEMAEWLDTIPYEIMCIMGGQNPRVYVKSGQR